MTAEHNVLMTTLDSMMMDAELCSWLGTDISEQIRDLFVRDSGPKLRDLLSHGVLSASLLPSCFVVAVKNVILRACVRFSIGKKGALVPQYRPLFSQEALQARAWDRLVDLFATLLINGGCEFPKPELPKRMPNCNRRVIASLTELGIALLRRGSPQAVVLVCVPLLFKPDEKLAQVLTKSLERNELSRMMHLCGCFVGLPVPQDRIAKRERSLFEAKAFE
jgi:hypothetical protein